MEAMGGGGYPRRERLMSKETRTPCMRLGRRVAIGLAIVAILGSATGCEQVNRFSGKSRSNDDEVVRALREETRVDNESPEDREARDLVRKFFKPNRLSGALSSEAAEIERNLGVGR